MKKIEIFSGCMNSSTRIDGIDINDIPLDELRTKVKTLVDSGNASTLKEILELLIEMDNNYELIDESNDKCGQCGDYIWDRVYQKVYKK